MHVVGVVGAEKSTAHVRFVLIRSSPRSSMNGCANGCFFSWKCLFA